MANKSYTELISPIRRKVLKNGCIVTLIPLQDVFDNSNTIKSNYKNWFNDPEVTKYNSHGLFPYDPRTDINEFLKDKSRLIWAIIVLGQWNVTKNIIHIGNVSLQSINLFNRSAELACVIGETDFWGKGIMTWACEQIIDHGFLKLGLHRIWSGTSALNIGMQKVFDKLVFTLDGTCKEGQFLDGSFYDVKLFGLLKCDWISRIKGSDLKDFNYFYTKAKEILSEDDIDEGLIQQMQEARSQNNVNWMDLVRLAFKADREKAKEIMKGIVACDKKIGKISQSLSE